MAQFVFWVKSRLPKNAFYKNCFQTKVVTNQDAQLSYSVTFFDILCHFEDIAAYLTHRESIVPSCGTDFSFCNNSVLQIIFKSTFWVNFI